MGEEMGEEMGRKKGSGRKRKEMREVEGREVQGRGGGRREERGMINSCMYIQMNSYSTHTSMYNELKVED